MTNASSAVIETTIYDPWGAVKSGGTQSKFLYTGQEKDSETGLHYYNARYYSSQIRRFTQPDDIIQDVSGLFCSASGFGKIREVKYEAGIYLFDKL